jgi:hypothetical protein
VKLPRKTRIVLVVAPLVLFTLVFVLLFFYSARLSLIVHGYPFAHVVRREKLDIFQYMETDNLRYQAVAFSGGNPVGVIVHPFGAIAYFEPFSSQSNSGIGNTPRGHSQTPATTEKHAILNMLAARDRNEVHVALWTLEQNGVSISQKISFDLPYSEARPQIQSVHAYLQTFTEEKLNALDRSLSNHMMIYSPIWSSNDWP